MVHSETPPKTAAPIMQSKTYDVDSALRRRERPEFVGFSPFVSMVEFEPLAPLVEPVDPVLVVFFGAFANASCGRRVGRERHANDSQ